MDYRGKIGGWGRRVSRQKLCESIAVQIVDLELFLLGDYFRLCCSLRFHSDVGLALRFAFSNERLVCFDLGVNFSSTSPVFLLLLTGE